MASQQYKGKLKYLGQDSHTSDFKLATVVIQDDKRIKSFLKCNPNQVFRSVEVKSNYEVAIKAKRLILKSENKREFWELHFVGESDRVTENLRVHVLRAIKSAANKTSIASKAQVGFEKRLGGARIGNSPTQNGAADLDKENQSSPMASRRTNVSPLSVSSTPQSSPIKASNSPVFTSVKTSRRLSGDSGLFTDDSHKQNQFRGMLSIDVDKKPVLSSASGVRFYGSSASDSYSLPVPRPKALERIKQEKKPGQLSDITKTYTWDDRRVVQEQIPQLIGFANLGNTCFMNAILQSLFSLDPFSTDLQSLHKQHGKTITKESLPFTLTRLMVARQRPQFVMPERLEMMLRGVKDAISSTAKRFSGSQQHDAHEFLAQVLDQLKEEVVQVLKPKEDPKETASRSRTTSTSSSGDPPDPSSSNREKPLSWREEGDNKSREDNTLPDLSPVAEKGDSGSDGSFFGREKKSPSSREASSPLGGSHHKKASTPAGVDRKRLSSVGNEIKPVLPPSPPPESSEKPPMSSVLMNPTLANFEFEVVHSFECVNCHDQVEKAEQFNDLSVDIPVNRLPGLKLSLQDALDMYFQKGEITDYACEKCGVKKSTAVLTHRFAKLPRILIVHVKRYSFLGRSRKVLEDMQLPRFITLQDHCDVNTTPHLPHRLVPASPMKSPMTPGSVKGPIRFSSADSLHRRRRLISTGSENGENETPKEERRQKKKVRRSLLSEVGAEPISDSEKKNDSSFEDDMEKAIEESKKDVVVVSPPEAENDIFEDELQKVLELSRREYEASNHFNYTGSGCDGDGAKSAEASNNNNNNDHDYNAQRSCPEEIGSMALSAQKLSSDGNEERDLTGMSEDDQLRLALNLSMASSNPALDFLAYPNSPPDADRVPDDIIHTSSAVFKKPFSTRTIRAQPPTETTQDSILTGGAAAGSLSDSIQMKNFTRTSDFVRDDCSIRINPEGSDDSDRHLWMSSTSSSSSSAKGDILPRLLRTPPSPDDDNHSDSSRKTTSPPDVLVPSDEDTDSCSPDHSFTSCRPPSPPGGPNARQETSSSSSTRPGGGGGGGGAISASIGTLGCFMPALPEKTKTEDSSFTGCNPDTMGEGLLTWANNNSNTNTNSNNNNNRRDPGAGIRSRKDSLDTQPPSNSSTPDSKSSSSTTTTKHFTSHSLTSSNPEESKLCPLMQDMKTGGQGESSDSSDSPPRAPRPVVDQGVWSPEEESMIAEEMEEEMMEVSTSDHDRAVSFPPMPKLINGSVVKEDRDEKENLSPPSGKATHTLQAPVDKETEKKILKHKLRLTEIEKGIFPHSYRLVSIVNHLGDSSRFGHYVSDALDIMKQTWFSYDDKDVRKTSEAYVRTKRTSTGYIFFYLSKDIFDDIDNMRPTGSGKELCERLPSHS